MRHAWPTTELTGRSESSRGSSDRRTRPARGARSHHPGTAPEPAARSVRSRFGSTPVRGLSLDRGGSDPSRHGAVTRGRVARGGHRLRARRLVPARRRVAVPQPAGARLPHADRRRQRAVHRRVGMVPDSGHSVRRACRTVGERGLCRPHHGCARGRAPHLVRRARAPADTRCSVARPGEHDRRDGDRGGLRPDDGGHRLAERTGSRRPQSRRRGDRRPRSRRQNNRSTPPRGPS